jgi:hypothetical protein
VGEAVAVVAFFTGVFVAGANLCGLLAVGLGAAAFLAGILPPWYG